MFQFQNGAIIGAAIWYMLPAVIAVSIPKWCDYRSLSYDYQTIR